MLFKNSVHTAKKTQHFSITNISWFMLFKEIITVFSENPMKPINTLCGQNAELLIVEAHDTHHYHWALKG
jgi:uracil DNA glycosylase